MPIILNCIALCILSIGTYLIWWDKRNVPNHMLIGFCIVGYIIPTFILDFSFFADQNILDLFIKINIIGTFFFVAGLFLGYKWQQVPIVDSVMKFSRIEQSLDIDYFETKILKVSTRIFIISLTVMWLCFLFMGFIPMFASDPYAAKQFKGVYQQNYQHVALFYRTANQFVSLLLPFLVLDIYTNKSTKSIILVTIAVVTIFITMSRGAAVSGLLIATSIIVSLRSGRFTFIGYIVLVIVIFSLGSGLWTILALVFPNSAFGQIGDNQTVDMLQSIASGAPDLTDQLGLLSAFVNNHIDYTYGVTFFGGLIPFNFKWNPSVWSLTVLNQNNDISEISSGGLRVTIPLWGYFSFGWVGVGVIPFISAFFTGYITKRIKNITHKLKANFKGYIIFYFLLFAYYNIALVFTNFFNLSIYSLPAFVFYTYVFYRKKEKVVVI